MKKPTTKSICGNPKIMKNRISGQRGVAEHLDVERRQTAERGDGADAERGQHRAQDEGDSPASRDRLSVVRNASRQ